MPLEVFDYFVKKLIEKGKVLTNMWSCIRNRQKQFQEKRVCISYFDYPM